MSTLRRVIGMLGLLGVAGLGLASPAARAQGVQPSASALWVQNSGTSADSAVSANVVDYSGGAISTQAADDFVVTLFGNQAWNIQTVTVLGTFNNASPSIDQIKVRLYQDRGGLPALSASAYQSVPIASVTGAPNFVIPVNLFAHGSPGGTRYWISVQANIVSSPSHVEQWYWLSSSTSGGTGEGQSAWVETTDPNVRQPYYGSCPWPNWGLRLTCLTQGDAARPNLAFRLDGQVLTFSSKVFLPVVSR